MCRPSGKRPRNPGRGRAGLAQRTGSGRTGLGQQRPAGEERRECVVANARREVCRSDPELGWEIGCGGAAQAVAAAREAVVVLMLVMGRGFPGVMGVLFRRGFEMSATQMQRSMSVAANKSERQQDDQASDP
jgi:hypothetical protein